MLEEHVRDTVRLKPEQLHTKPVGSFTAALIHLLVTLVKPFLCSFHKRHRAVCVGYPSVWLVKPNTPDSDHFASDLKNLLAAA